MESFGAFIRAEREKQGISLRDISNATKISHHILEALESDHVEEFPYPAFAKGFLTTYAKQLGLDSKEVISRYMDFFNSTQSIIQNRLVVNEKPQLGRVGLDQTRILLKAEGMHNRRFMPTFLIIFLIVGIWFAWSVFLKQTTLSMHENRRSLPITRNAEKLNEGIAKVDTGTMTVQKEEKASEAQSESGAQDVIASSLGFEKAMAGAIFERTLLNMPRIEKTLLDTSEARTTAESSPAPEGPLAFLPAAKAPVIPPVDASPRPVAKASPLPSIAVSSQPVDYTSVPPPVDVSPRPGTRLLETLSVDAPPQQDMKSPETASLDASSLPQNADETAVENAGPKKELVITATARTWIDVQIDDQPNYDFIIEPGDMVKLKAFSNFTLLIGNAGGVTFCYEGETFGPIGEIDQVKRLTLPQQP